MTYQPYLISDFSTGLDLGREPWVQPADAFVRLENGYVYRGSVRKREGFETLDFLPVVETTVSAIDTGTDTITLASAAGLSDGDRVRIVDAGGVSGLNGVTAFVTNKSGSNIQLLDENGDAIDITGTYTTGGTVYSYPGLPITGLLPAIDNANAFQTLAFDENQAAYWNETNGYFIPITGTTFTGSESDYFQGYNWRDSAGGTDSLLYFCNGVDRIHTWNPNTNAMAVPTLDTNDDASNDIELARFIFASRQRMCLFYTQENGTLYPARMRWSKADDPTDWVDIEPGRGGFIDAPTSQFLIDVKPLGDDFILIFDDGYWLAKYIGDPNLPWVMQRIGSGRAIGYPFGGVTLDEFVVSMGPNGLYATDQQQSVRVDEKIPDYASGALQSDKKRVWGARYSPLDQVIWNYPSLESEDGRNDKALVWSYKEGAWSEYNVALTVMGTVRFDDDRTWDDYGEQTWDDLGDELWVDPEYQDDYPSFVAGAYDGRIVQLDRDVVNDDGTAFTLTGKTAELNPFKEEGLKAQLGYVELYLDVDPNSKFEVSFFTNDSDVPYRTQTVYAVPETFPYSEITDATQANPCVLGVPNHAFQDGDPVTVYQVGGMVELNGVEFTATVVDDDHISLDVDSSAFTAYTSGGIVGRGSIDTDKCFVGLRAGAIGYGHSLQIEHSDGNSSFKMPAMIWYFLKSGRRFNR